MRVYYLDEIPVLAIWDKDISSVAAPEGLPYIEMDEGVNDALLRDLKANIAEVDRDGDPKYRIIKTTGGYILREKDNWEAFIEVA